MKIAIQMPGNPRSFKRCYNSYMKNLIETLEPDVFIHTWRQHGKERPDVTTDGTCEEYLELYNPIVGRIEDLYYDYQPLHTMVPHFTSRYRVNEMRKEYELKNNVKYDVVICHRSDVKLLSPFKKEFVERVEEDTIWIHHFTGPAQPSTRNAIPSDYLFYTTPKWMNITADCYFEMDKLDYYRPGSERLWWYKLEKEGFKYEQFRFYGNKKHDQEHIDKSYKLFDTECIR